MGKWDLTVNRVCVGGFVRECGESCVKSRPGETVWEDERKVRKCKKYDKVNSVISAKNTD